MEWKLGEKPYIDSSFSPEYEVFVCNDKDDDYPDKIGRVRLYPSREEERKPSWGISHVGLRSEWVFDYESKVSQRPAFNTKEDAAAGLFMIWSAMEANPCPPDIARYLDGESRDLSRAEGALREQFYTLQHKRISLSALAKKHGLKVLNGKKDAGESIKALSTFLDEHIDTLYEVFGKDGARSLRALIANVVEEIDPQAALDF